LAGRDFKHEPAEPEGERKMSRWEYELEPVEGQTLRELAAPVLRRVVAATRNAPLTFVELTVARGAAVVVVTHGDRQHMVVLGFDAVRSKLLLRIEPLALDAMRLAGYVAIPTGMLLGSVGGWYVMSPSLLAVPFGLFLGVAFAGGGTWGLFRHWSLPGRLPRSLGEAVTTSVEVVDSGIELALEPLAVRRVRVTGGNLGAWDTGTVVRLTDEPVTEERLRGGDAAAWTRYWLEHAADISTT
jgi:hypothetical protein